MPKFPRRIASIAVALAILPLAVAAQTKPNPAEPPELKTFRATYQQQREMVSKPIQATYLADLRALEKRLVDQGDYEGASVVRSRQNAVIESSSKPAPAAPAATPPGDPAGIVVLDLSKTKFSGSGVARDARAKALTGWKKPGLSASWDLFGVKPGEYRILIRYGCRDRSYSETSGSKYAGGEFQVEEESRLEVPSQTLKHVVKSTGGWDRVVVKDLGTLALKGGTSQLKLTVRSAHTLGLMYLYEIRLVPVAPAAAGANGPPPGSKDPGLPKALLTLSGAFCGNLGRSAERAIADYIAGLKALEAALIKSDQLAAAKEVQVERVAAEELLVDPRRLLVMGIDAAENADPNREEEREFGGGGGELLMLDKLYQKNLGTAQSELAKKYSAALGRLKDRLTKELQFEAAVMVRSEQEKVAATLIELAKAKPGTGVSERGFGRIDGAKLVANESNGGDRFLVSHYDKQYHFRLYSVNCPEHPVGGTWEADDLDRLKAEAAYWGITLEQSAQVGIDAAAMVANLFKASSNPVTFYTKWEETAPAVDRFKAFCKIGDRFLSEILVENGLAQVSEQTTALPDGRGADDFRKHLKSLEAEAKAKRRGAWGF